VARAPFTLAFPEDDGRPVFVRISAGFVEAIRRGRLDAGSALPSSRALAHALEVHRNTVLAAYAELQSQGWVTTAAGKGTFVSAKLPEVPLKRGASHRARMPEHPGYSLAPALPAPSVGPPLPRGSLSLAGGVPDLRLVPSQELSRAYRRAITGSDHSVLDYGNERGHPRLRGALATFLDAARGVTASAEDVLITRGSQMGFYLAARAIVRPGDVVAVEALGYAPAWAAFRAAGAEVVPVSVDAHGLVIDELRELVKRRPIAALYITPHHQYPTLAVLSADRRLALLELARTHRFAVVEDDYDNEIHYHGRPVLPLASADAAGVVVYVGSLSKVLAPGLRVGYVVAPSALIRRMAELRRSIDRQGDPAIERAIAELLEEDVVQRHTRKMRRIYQGRREALMNELKRRFGAALTFDVPAGGLALWAHVAPDVSIDVEEWQASASREGVYFRPPRDFAFDGRSRPSVRLAFAQLTEDELGTAVKRLHAAFAATRSTAPVRSTSRSG
jgi:GntR family transcriptional regulator/MocR family aminotransferase